MVTKKACGEKEKACAKLHKKFPSDKLPTTSAFEQGIMEPNYDYTYVYHVSVSIGVIGIVLGNR